MRWSPGDWRDWLVAAWSPLLVAVLLLPLLVRPGHPLARDLVFVPRQPFTDATWGLGDVAPRAVPLDAVVAALTHVVDGAVVARVVLPMSLVLFGWGVARLLTPLGRTAQLAGSGFAVWNAFVVERLALGQWALVLGCAALPWVVSAAGRYRRHGRARDAGAAIAWSALASVTPTGGLLALTALVVAAAPQRRRVAVLATAGVALQAPWVSAALTGTASGVSDASGVTAFAPDTESPYGAVVALLGLGGIWDAGSEPASRTTWMALVTAVAVVLALAVGGPALRRAWGTGDIARWVILAGVPAAIACAATTSWGEHLLIFLVGTVPGAGLLRDTQKLLAPAVVLVSAAFGASVGRACSVVRSRDVRPLAALVLVLAPILLLPDATTQTWPTVAPVELPDELEIAARRLDGERGLVVTLPWRAYRTFEWTRPGQTTSDPALRMVDADVVTSDSLQVGDTLVPGESMTAAGIGAALERGAPADVLARLGVTWVLLYPDDPAAAEVDTSGLELVMRSAIVELYQVPGAAPPDEQGPTGRSVAVWSAHLLAFLVALVATATRILPSRERDAGRGLM